MVSIGEVKKKRSRLQNDGGSKSSKCIKSSIPCRGRIMNILQDESCDESVFFRDLSDVSEKVKNAVIVLRPFERIK